VEPACTRTSDARLEQRKRTIGNGRFRPHAVCEHRGGGPSGRRTCHSDRDRARHTPSAGRARMGAAKKADHRANRWCNQAASFGRCGRCPVAETNAGRSQKAKGTPRTTFGDGFRIIGALLNSVGHWGSPIGMTRVPTAPSIGHVDERRDHTHSPMLRFEAFRHWKSLTVLLNFSRRTMVVVPAVQRLASERRSAAMP
jgi:hypothetical protein